MGTTTEKLNHLKGTRDLQQAYLIEQGKDVNDETPFREFLEHFKSLKPNLQDKSVSITSNGTQTITADEGYDGLNSVAVTTSVLPSLTRQIVFADDTLYSGKVFEIPADKKYAIIVMEASWKYNSPALSNECTTDNGTIETLTNTEKTFDIHTSYKVNVYRLTKTVGKKANVTCKVTNKQYGELYNMACVIY